MKKNVDAHIINQKFQFQFQLQLLIIRNELYQFKWKRHRLQIEPRRRLVFQRNPITIQRQHIAVYNRHLKRPISQIVVNASLNYFNA